MAKASTLAALFSLGACTGDSGETEPAPTPTPTTPTPTTPTPGALAISGDITESATWSGTVQLLADATIKPGAEVTIAPGTIFQAADEAELRVEGTLRVAGTAESRVSMQPLTSVGWTGIVVESGGSATLAHATGSNAFILLYCHQGALACELDSVEFTGIDQAMITEAPARIIKSTLMEMANGGVTVRTGGELTVEDSYIFSSSHDLIITSPGSKLWVSYSEIGGAQGSYEHCGLHIGGADELSITRSNIISSVYGIMIGGTEGAVIQYNNFIDNDPNQDVLQTGANTNLDMRYNYWSQAAPSGAGMDTSNPEAAPYSDAGPRI